MSTAETGKQQGSLNSTPFARVFYKLGSGRASGRLMVTQGRFTKEVYFRRGQVMHVTSTREDELLGEYLVAAGRIDREQLLEALVINDGGGSRLGEQLVRLGVISDETLRLDLVGQNRLRLLDLFGWTLGDFHYESGVGTAGYVAPIPEEWPLLLWAGIKQKLDAESLRQFFAARAGRHVCMRNLEASNPFHSGFGAAGHALMTRIDGARTVEQLVRMTAKPGDEMAGEDALRRILFTLAAIDAIVLSPTPAASPQGPQRPSTLTMAFDPTPALQARYDGMQGKPARQILGVTEAATPEVITAAYFRLMREFHPSLITGDTPADRLRMQIFARIDGAYKELVDKRTTGQVVTSSTGENIALTSPAELEREGRALIAKGQYADAVKLLAKALNTFPDAHTLKVYLGWATYLLGRPTKKDARKEAIALMQKAIIYVGRHADCAYFMGHIKAEEGDTAKATEYYKRALALDPRHEAADKMQAFIKRAASTWW